MDDIITYVVDIGKESQNEGDNNFWWINSKNRTGKSMKTLIEDLISSLKRFKVSIGFDYPMYFDVKESKINGARLIDGNRAWSAGAGALVLPTGLSQTNYIVRIICDIYPDIKFNILSKFNELQLDYKVYLWEAFVSSSGKPELNDSKNQHLADASAALNKYLELMNLNHEFHQKNKLPCVSLITSIFIANNCNVDMSKVNNRPIVIKL